MVENLPCGLSCEEAYASMDWVDRYMMGMDTLWGTSLVIISRVLDSISHIGQQMIQEDTRVCHSIQDYTLAHGGAQRIFGVFPLGRPPNTVIEYTIRLRLPYINEWIGEPQREVYTSMIDFHLGYHQAWTREQGIHRSIPGYHHELFVMPLGLTNVSDTFQSFLQWKRHMLLLFDTLII
jgi:hypothetical protein